MTDKVKYYLVHSIGPIISLAGMIIIFEASNWFTMLGVVVLVWGNNVERRINREPRP